MRFIRGGVGKRSFSGRKDGESPESLIIVTEGECYCFGFVVLFLADLVEQSFGHEVVELVVAGVMPVVNPTLNNAAYQHSIPPETG